MTPAEYETRIQDLLEANNRYLERARKAEEENKTLRLIIAAEIGISFKPDISVKPIPSGVSFSGKIRGF